MDAIVNEEDLQNLENLQSDGNESEHALINDIDNNGYLIHEGEFFDMEKDGGFQFEGTENESPNFSSQSFECSIIGKTFDDANEAYNFYNEHGLSRGFGIRRHYTNRHMKTNKVYRHVFVCNKQGQKEATKKDVMQTNDVTPHCIKRIGCKAMMQVTLSKQGKWVIDKVFDEHNHPFDLSQLPRQWSHKVFYRSKKCRDLVTKLSKSGMRPSEITKVVNAYAGDQADKLTRVQCSAIVSGERKVNLGKECHGIIIHFQEKAQLDKDFYFAIDLCADGTLRNVFWADGRSRSSYNHFGDVVVFDVTYKTNHFGLPFSPFVGVNHHGQSILFGAALLENENEATFTWLFKHFLKCMHDSPPISIITDQDLAICKAIGKVFPNSRHRFCAWHIRKHVLEHLQPLRSRYDDFQDTYNKWVKNQNVGDFEKGWEELKKKYHIDDNTWLGNMYKLRGYWAVCNRRNAEEDQDSRNINSKPSLHSDHPIEAMAAECYTRNIYDIFKKEWKASFGCGHEKISKQDDLVKYRVGCLKVDREYWKTVEYKLTSDFFATCSCARFETSGILCKHILYIMKRKQLTSIPDHYILPRWTVKATYNVGSSGKRWRNFNSEGSTEVSFMTLWSTRAKFNKALEEGRDSPPEVEKLNALIDDFLEEQKRRKKTRIDEDSEVNLDTQTHTQVGMSQHLLASDPKNPVKTKGRPKVSNRIKSSVEMALDPKKKKKCRYCAGTGHNYTGCQRRKMDQMSKNKNNMTEATMDEATLD